MYKPNYGGISQKFTYKLIDKRKLKTFGKLKRFNCSNLKCNNLSV